MSILRDAALDYAARDWPVLPCGPRGKQPMTAHGLLDATIDPTIIHGWWTRWPTANVGLRTGDVFDVLDIDGDEGFHELGRLINGTRLLPGGPAVTTGNGCHVFFQPTGSGNRARFRPGLDWRGAGGYVVAPPSVHPSGREYTWHTDADVSLEWAPQWLRDLLAPLRPGPTAWRTRVVGSAYARAALHSEVHRVKDAPIGTRNDTLNRAAFNIGQLIGECALDTTEACGFLLGAALTSGLPEAEARRTLRSGIQAGVDHPRRVA